MRDYLENNHENKDKVIDNLFTSYNSFIKELKEVFKEVDKKRIVEREL
jgi:tRNA A-37 threonylcarbamoyl transferase component Bud32